MSTPNRPSVRPAGASPVGGSPNRRKWLLPLIIGVIALIVILLLLSRCGNDDNTDSTSGTAATNTGTAAPTGTTTITATASPSEAASSGAGADAKGTVTVDGDDLLNTQTSIGKGGRDGEQVVGHAVTVQSVPADEGFWVGTSTTDRLWVQLSGTHGESDYKVKTGDAIDFTGTVKAADKSFAESVGVTADEGASQLTQQGHYISVPSSNVKLFH